MDIAAYLRRIGYDGPLAATAETLQWLHRAHLLTVPFENLDIVLGRPIVLDEAEFFAKIVERKRGGFCYELNGLFAALLRELGFPVALLSGRVPDADRRRVHEFDHLTLLVEADGWWLADVGFGDCFVKPLRLEEDLEQAQAGATYRLSRDGPRWLVARRDRADWNLMYDFTMTPHPLAAFAEMCRYHQTSPDSPFTGRRICSRATSEGRVTLADMRLIETCRGERRERVLKSDAEYAAALRQHFGIELQAAASQG